VGVVVLIIFLVRSRGGDKTGASPAAVEVQLCDAEEDQEDAVSLANPLEGVDIFASTM
jgi:hypothetical protein